MKDVIILGCGGHAKVVADIVLRSQDRLRGFLCDDLTSDTFLGRPILGRPQDYTRFADCEFVLAIGSPEARKRLSQELVGARFYTAIHPDAVVSLLDTEIGEGTMILANAVVGPSARVGRHCILNTACVVEHDNEIDDFVHVSVGAHLAGGVKVGEGTLLGIGSAVAPNLSICADCTVGAGAVVVKDLAAPGTYVGVPAKKIK